MKIHPFARIAALGLILLALGTATAFARPEKSRSGLPSPNLAIGVLGPEHEGSIRHGRRYEHAHRGTRDRGSARVLRPQEQTGRLTKLYTGAMSGKRRGVSILPS